MKPVEQAACDALRLFLAGEFPGVPIIGRWPAADKPLPDRTISIVRVGQRKEFEIDKAMTNVTPIPNTNTVTTRWRVKAITQGVQLDVWSTDGAARDDMQGQLDVSLNKGTRYTIDPSIEGLSRSTVRDGPLVAFDPASGHQGFADFTFDGVLITDTPDAIANDEFRATYQGELSAILELTTTDPLMLRVLLQQHLTPNSDATDQYALSSADRVAWTYSPTSP